MNALPMPRPGIRAVRPYIGGESTLPGRDKVIKLASNEGALGPSPEAVAALQATAAIAHRYPDGGCTALRQALGAMHDIDPATIVCGAGSDELISLLCRAYVGPGDEVLHTEHGFLMYPIAARTAGAAPVAVMETSLKADVDALLAGISPRTRMVFLANPNNPTSTYLTDEEIGRLRAELPPDVILVIDAAYAEYVDRNDYDPGHRRVEAGDNVVVTRTFSKIYGLGGVRLGWAHCPPAVADVLNRVRNPFNVAAPAQAAGQAALADGPFVEQAKAHNAVWRAWTVDRLREGGFDIPDGVGNFVLVRFGNPAEADAADAHLRWHGIIVRGMTAYGLPHCLRVTIGLEHEMRAVVEALLSFNGAP